MLRTASPRKAHAVQNIENYRPCSAACTPRQHKSSFMLLLCCQDRRKVYGYNATSRRCLSIQRKAKDMPYFEDEGMDLQRMPGTKRPTTHTPARTDTTVHTPDHPFCYDPKCTCRANQEALQAVQQWVNDGLMTEVEASEYIAGRTL